MPGGDKSSYTDKQTRKADHIAEGYAARGVSDQEAERRAWATVNKDDGGGKKSGSGRGAHTGYPAAHRGGEISAQRSAAIAPPRRARRPRPASATQTITPAKPKTAQSHYPEAHRPFDGAAMKLITATSPIPAPEHTPA